MIILICAVMFAPSAVLYTVKSEMDGGKYLLFGWYWSEMKTLTMLVAVSMRTKRFQINKQDLIISPFLCFTRRCNECLRRYYTSLFSRTYTTLAKQRYLFETCNLLTMFLVFITTINVKTKVVRFTFGKLLSIKIYLLSCL